MQGKLFCRPKDKNEWLAARRLGITGTDVAAICGESPYKNALSVFIDKVNPLPNKENEAMMLGTYLEDPIAKLWAKNNGASIRKVNYIIQKHDNPLVLANIDRHIIKPEEAILECKLAGPYQMKRWDNNNVPQEYYLQVMWYMLATGIRKAHLAALVGGINYVERVVEYDEEVATAIETIAMQFWHDHVVTKTPPAIDGSTISKELIDRLYPKSDGLRIDVAGTMVDHFVAEYQRGKAMEKEAEAVVNEATSNIKNILGEHELAVTPLAKITWKNQTSNTIDNELLRKNYPDVAAACAKQSSFRRMLITITKE